MVYHAFRRVFSDDLLHQSRSQGRPLGPRQRRFERHGILSVTRYPAVDGKLVRIPDTWDDVPGAYGCLMSHVGMTEGPGKAGPLTS